MLPKKLKTQYAIRVVRATGLTRDLYISPAAMTCSNATYGTTQNIDMAAAFGTPEDARSYWKAVAPKFKGYRPELVTVEHTVETQIVEAKPALNAIETGLFYVLTYSSPNNVRRFAYRAGLGSKGFDYAAGSDEAERFVSITTALQALAKRPTATSLVNGIAAFRETTVNTHKVVAAVPLETPQVFTSFAVEGSSVISMLAYAHESKTLRITMKRGARKFSTNSEPVQPDSTYEYSDVEAADVFAFVAAPSKGSHFSKVFKAKYDKKAKRI